MHTDRAQISLASLPALHPRSISADPPEIDALHILQKYDLRRFKQLGMLEFCVSGITLVFHGREHSIVDQPLYIDIASDSCTKVLLTHFALVPAGSSTGQADCALVPLGESPLDTMYRATHSLHLEWLDRRCIQSFVVEGSTLHVCVSDVDGETSATVAGILATPGLRANETNIDFCSFSGKVCARMPVAGQGFKVVIMDYVVPKETRSPADRLPTFHLGTSRQS
jgi:hypothetical protein